MQARSVYGLTEMPMNDEFEHLVLIDVFISTYVMGRQKVRRTWYQTNREGFKRAMEDNEAN